MSNENAEKKKRNVFRTSNKYQEQIMLITFLPSVVISLSFMGIILLADPIVTTSIEHTSFVNMEKIIHHDCLLIILLMFVFLSISLVISFKISKNMVGAFGRIIRELDDVIAGRTKKYITTRPGDTLSKELLKRVNFLIKHYVVSKHEKENTK